jgi:hypothetical protein
LGGKQKIDNYIVLTSIFCYYPRVSQQPNKNQYPQVMHIKQIPSLNIDYNFTWYKKEHKIDTHTHTQKQQFSMDFSWAVIEPSFECPNSVHLILFRIQAELELITDLENLSKLSSFIFLADLSLFTNYSINLFISYIK